MTPEEAITALLDIRGVGKTICPSEAARLLERTNGSWRSHMGEVHTAAMRLYKQGAILCSWHGEPRTSLGGPYRISRP